MTTKENNSLTLASHYALKIALQTMKERCDKLQYRLTKLEDENIQLRVERQKLQSDISHRTVNTSEEVTTLEKKVTELNRQKSKLSHHLLIVANENKELWERLSNLTERNQDLSPNLIKASEIIRQQNKPDTSINILENYSKEQDQNLEEISLKLSNCLMKSDVETNTEVIATMPTLRINDCEFNLESEEQTTNESLLLMVNTLVEDLKKDSAMLKMQKDKLKKILEVTKQRNSEVLNWKCSKCKNADNENADKSVTVNLTEVKHSLNSLESTNKICPLCGTIFNETSSFEQFHEHVINHFVENDDESFSTNYEMVE